MLYLAVFAALTIAATSPGCRTGDARPEDARVVSSFLPGTLEPRLRFQNGSRNQFRDMNEPFLDSSGSAFRSSPSLEAQMSLSYGSLGNFRSNALDSWSVANGTAKWRSYQTSYLESSDVSGDRTRRSINMTTSPDRIRSASIRTTSSR